MDMFPDANLVREAQKELDTIIQEGVRSITRLIRASESQAKPGVAPGTGTNASHNQTTGSRGRGAKALSLGGPSGRADSSLGSKLVQDGLLTPELLQQLQKEWSKRLSQDGGTGKTSMGNATKGKKTNKKKWFPSKLAVLLQLNTVCMCLYVCVYAVWCFKNFMALNIS